MLRAQGWATAGAWSRCKSYIRLRPTSTRPLPDSRKLDRVWSADARSRHGCHCTIVFPVAPHNLAYRSPSVQPSIEDEAGTSSCPSRGASDPSTGYSFGLIAPTILMCIPGSIQGYGLQQFWILVWQFFPLWVSIWQLIFSILGHTDTNEGTLDTREKRRASVKTALEHVWNFAIFVSIITHLPVVVFSIVAQILGAVGKGGQWSHLSFANLFLPPDFRIATLVSSINEGALLFFQWDEAVSCASVLLWAFALHRQAGVAHLSRTVVRTVFLGVIAGPAAAACFMIKERDNLVLSQKVEEDEKKGD